ncbi:cell wall-binding repeat-containing protein [Georgenia sp. SYP-B2076]|uniref:cell wall-binding repeat-containing protein n=1 Tax=Georgenia sp. SYP-B2076 TaxID=2495881 RepID=UPI0013DF8DF6|nr:cell wall-binding repeat-containing protein [Georgenia sp. SYP-B2076]
MISRVAARPAALGLVLALLGVSFSVAPEPARAAVPRAAAAAADTAPPDAGAAAAVTDSTTATVEGAAPVTTDLETLEMTPEPATAKSAGPATEEVTVSGPGGDLVVVGVTWAEIDAGAGLTARLRSREGETWSGWTTLEITAPVTEGEASPEARGGTEPLAVMDADEIEVTLAGAPGTLPSDPQLAIVDPGTSAADAAAPISQPQPLTATGAGGITGVAGAGTFALPGVITPGAPTIRTRADWGADESIRTWAPEIGQVTGVVVHHTAGANGYAPEDVPAIIRGIYSYHAQSLRWGDIGYNVLVDAYGRAWEGRYGGLTTAVIGAHAKGVNSTTFGVSVLGNFDLVPIPDAAFRTVAQVIAWKFAVHGITTSGTAKGLNGNPIARVVGHRDVGQTACPGKYFYPRIKTELVGLVDDYQALMPAGMTAPMEEVVRLAGDDRYETSVAASRYAHDSADVVFVTTGKEYADALSAGPAATRLGAPVLLVQPGAVPAEVRAELDRLNPRTIYVLGGTTAVSESVVGVLRGYAAVTRLDGANRYETSAAVGRAVWTGTTPTVYLASGQDFADGLSGGAAASATGAPVYVTTPRTLAAPIRTELARLRPSKVVILGGTAAVSKDVVAQVQQLLPGVTVSRLAGNDRYETAAAVAASTWPNGSATVFLATGTGFADALSGVPAAGSRKAPVLLTRPECLAPSVKSALTALDAASTVLLGGPSAVAESAETRAC